MSKPVIAVVGRPNTGKSTFFNKVVGKRISIVKDEPGVTRDRIYGDAEWLFHKFTLIDTGGIEFNDKSQVNKNILTQVQIAVELADAILFFVDANTGITAGDYEVAEYLRKSRKKVFVVVNKVDNNQEEKVYDFYDLGINDVFAISSEQGKGIGDLLDAVVNCFDQSVWNEEDEERIKIAIVGKPNVGKSSLTNSLLSTDRMVVSDIAGTTRDAIDIPFDYNGKKYTLIDTAGVRRKRSVELESIESYSVLRSFEAIRRADVVLIVFDASTELSEQDVRLAGYVHEEGKPNVVLMNKWDLVEKDTFTMDKFEQEIKEQLNFMPYSERVYVSAKTQIRLNKIIPLVEKVYENANKQIKTSVLNDLLSQAVALNQPPVSGSKRLKLYFVAQTGTKPPTFTFQANEASLVHFSYHRYLENFIRKSIDFSGTPIKLIFKSKPKREVK